MNKEIKMDGDNLIDDRFEDFLKKKFPATGVLYDDMPDAFEAWLDQLDTEELIDYADEWADEIRKK